MSPFLAENIFSNANDTLPNLVGASMLRDFYGAVTADKAVKGIIKGIIIRSDFTAQAREFAERVGVELINLRRLQNLFAQYGMERSN